MFGFITFSRFPEYSSFFRRRLSTFPLEARTSGFCSSLNPHDFPLAPCYSAVDTFPRVSSISKSFSRSPRRFLPLVRSLLCLSNKEAPQQPLHHLFYPLLSLRPPFLFPPVFAAARTRLVLSSFKQPPPCLPFSVILLSSSLFLERSRRLSALRYDPAEPRRWRHGKKAALKELHIFYALTATWVVQNGRQ